MGSSLNATALDNKYKSPAVSICVFMIVVCIYCSTLKSVFMLQILHVCVVVFKTLKVKKNSHALVLFQPSSVKIPHRFNFSQ